MSHKWVRVIPLDETVTFTLHFSPRQEYLLGALSLIGCSLAAEVLSLNLVY